MITDSYEKAFKSIAEHLVYYPHRWAHLKRQALYKPRNKAYTMYNFGGKVPFLDWDYYGLLLLHREKTDSDVHLALSSILRSDDQKE